MKSTKLFLTVILVFALGFAQAQNDYNPWKKYGYTPPKALTLSDGKYQEFFDADTIVQIGSVMLNTKTNKIVGFVEYDTTYSEATLEPHITSRWLSPDPLAKEYPSWSPYAFCYNSPISVIDPDGREGIIVSGQPGDHTGREHFLINGLDRARTMASQYKKEGNGEKATWFIYNGGGKGGYDASTIKNYTAEAAKYGISVQVVSSANEIVNYVNEKNGGDSRSKDLVSKFAYSGHATRGDLDIGFEDHGFFNMLTNTKIEPSDFSGDAFKSGAQINVVGGCNTAIDGELPGEKSVIEQFADKVDSKSTIKGSNVSVGYMGGKRTDKQLVKYMGTDGKQVNGSVVEIKGKKK